MLAFGRHSSAKLKLSEFLLSPASTLDMKEVGRGCFGWYLYGPTLVGWLSARLIVPEGCQTLLYITCSNYKN